MSDSAAAEVLDGKLFADVPETAEILRSLTPLIEGGDLPLPKAEAYPLARAPEIYRGLAASTIKGKPVLVT